MDIATIIGLLGGTALVLSAIIVGGSALIFINIPGVLIVIGGTLATCFIKFSMGDVINTIKVVMKAFLVKMEPPDETVIRLVALAKIAKKEGLIALENEKTEDAYTAKAVQYLSDGIDEGLIEDMLNKDIRLTVQRHSVGQNVFKGMGASAPAFGMIGTLIGLVQMLASMSDPSSIGPAMAVALLTTFYGSVLANLVFVPVAGKLRNRSKKEIHVKDMIVTGVIALTIGDNPRVMEQKLLVFMPPKQRKSRFD